MSRLRGGLTLAGFLGLTLPLMPLQAAFRRSAPRLARRFPHWYHRQVLKILGIRLTVEGDVVPGPVLLVSNHTSWLDIPVLSAVAPVSFVAKREVASWPLVAQLARLQRTVFVDRQKRSASGAVVDEIAGRLAAGDAMVLFAEGTSSDGNRVLPFRSALFGAVLPKPIKPRPAGADPVEPGSGEPGPGEPGPGESGPGESGADGSVLPARAGAVQTASLVYTHRHGLLLGRADRPHIGWYGDMEMTGHAWRLLQGGPIDVTVRLGQAVPIDHFVDRKALARHTEIEIRANVVALLRGRTSGTGA